MAISVKTFDGTTGPVTAFPIGEWALPTELLHLPDFPVAGESKMVAFRLGLHSIMTCAEGKSCWILRPGADLDWKPAASMIETHQESKLCKMILGSEVMLAGSGILGGYK